MEMTVPLDDVFSPWLRFIPMLLGKLLAPKAPKAPTPTTPAEVADATPPAPPPPPVLPPAPPPPTPAPVQEAAASEAVPQEGRQPKRRRKATQTVFTSPLGVAGTTLGE